VRFLFQMLGAPLQKMGGGSAHPLGLRTRMQVVSTVAGMRGAVSLAIALSVPLTAPDGTVLTGRDDIIFVTAGVILLSLLVQGPLLPAVVRWARYPVDHAEDEEYELAERAISGAAMAALDTLAAEHGISDEVRDRARREGYEMLEFANAKAAARERALIDAEVGAMEDLLDAPDPLADGSVELADAPVELSAVTAVDPVPADGTTLQMVATSTDIDLEQRSPLIRHEELTRLKLAMIDHKREVLSGLRRAGTIDDLVVSRISARLDLDQIRLQGLEAVE
jgi:CPA1 family monovalent cation:H+ antiporter